MSLVSDTLDTLSALPAGLILLVAGAMAFAESGIGIGMVLPGETLVLVASASVDNRALLGALLVVVTITGSAGDHVSYLLGRRYGPSMRNTSVVRRMGVPRWDQAMGALDRHGAVAIFLTRLVPVVRTFAPAAAGVSGVRYNRFLPASLAAAALWAAVYVCAGALARASLEQAENILGTVGWIVLGLLVAAGIVIFAVRRIRTRKHAESYERAKSVPRAENPINAVGEKDPS
ncbi:membrane protein DedA with SNARE-associated domain [Actinopolyspora biskrensis]|uniref:Membrane protein DedA with SNARE-associated domain n=1 Tax=Actinopolyspora biskrensis TaxID=1470178 RepID=A0A852Z034_9ACTN|nr:DedA family protein [Actinopolyspora biskrensis]NYH77016.1 membrane protein DedA with SNARE-associated domain [Actinopolyspora biskrensis]